MKRDTKQRIERAFINLYRTKPIEKITVREITAAAGVNRCTFYAHYSDVYALADKIETDLIAKISAALRNIDRPLDSPAAFEPFIAAIHKLYQEESEMLSVMLAKGHADFYAKLRQIIGGIFISHMPQLKEENKETLAYAFEYQLSGLIGIFSLWVRSEHKLSSEELFYYAKGLSTEGFMKTLVRLSCE